MTDFMTLIEDIVSEGLTAGLYLRVPSLLVSTAAYVFYALGLYTIARRRGLHHAWLSWIPLGSTWVLGALSDQYRYITRCEDRNKRRSLLILSIVSAVLSAVALLVGGVVMVRVIHMIASGADLADFAELGLQLVGLLALLLPAWIVGTILLVIRCIALFDLFCSADPRNRWLYMILCVLSPYALPLILFFNRERDDGMPPRIPDAIPQSADQYQP